MKYQDAVAPADEFTAFLPVINWYQTRIAETNASVQEESKGLTGKDGIHWYVIRQESIISTILNYL